MRLKFSLIEGLSLIRTLLKMSNKSLSSRVYSLIKNIGQDNSDVKDVMEFMFGKRESYLGLIISQGRKVKHSIYLLIDNGKVREAGNVKLKSRIVNKALKELYTELGKRGEVSKVVSYKKGGDVLFHPN